MPVKKTKLTHQYNLSLRETEKKLNRRVSEINNFIKKY